MEQYGDMIAVSAEMWEDQKNSIRAMLRRQMEETIELVAVGGKKAHGRHFLEWPTRGEGCVDLDGQPAPPCFLASGPHVHLGWKVSVS